MKPLENFRITRAMAVRMLADAVMINISLALALALQLLLTVVAHGPGSAADLRQMLGNSMSAFWQSEWLLTVVCLAVFAYCGFYTYGRFYQGRYKALVITQAVLQSYLLAALLMYLFRSHLPWVGLTGPVLLSACLINLAMALGSRTWVDLWERIVHPEREARLRANGNHTRRVLVIGGAGYIGSALLPKLLQRGYRVRVLDLFLYGKEPIQEVLDHPRLELVKGDFRHVQTVVAATRGMDAVVHLGAIVGDPACDLDEDVTLKVNLGATQMIAQVAKASGISRFVFASTCSVYGACDTMLDERSDVRPISLYGNTKLAAERGLRSMAGKRFRPTVLRFATIYGLSGRTRFDLVVNLLAAKAKKEGCITIQGGNQWRPLVHVDDAARAVLKVVESPLELVGSETFNVGSDRQNYTIREIGEQIHRQAPEAELLVEESCTDARNYRVSFRKIRERLGFRPEWTLERGISQVFDALASGRVGDYRDAKYSNVKFLGEAGAIELVRIDDDWTHRLLATRSALSRNPQTQDRRRQTARRSRSFHPNGHAKTNGRQKLNGGKRPAGVALRSTPPRPRELPPQSPGQQPPRRQAFLPGKQRGRRDAVRPRLNHDREN